MENFKGLRLKLSSNNNPPDPNILLPPKRLSLKVSAK